MIIESIDNGYYNQNKKIPSEIKLCEMFNVSRITVRKAIKELIDDGRLISYQGKGTFVTSNKIENELLNVGGFTDFGIRNNTNTYQKTITKKIVKSTKYCEKLNVPIDSDLFKLERVFYLNNEPLFIDCSHIPLYKFKDFDIKYNNGDSTYRIFRDNYNTNICIDDKIINVKMAGSFEARHLKCSVGEPLFYIEKIGMDKFKDKIHTSNLYCRANRVSLTINHHPIISSNQ